MKTMQRMIRTALLAAAVLAAVPGPTTAADDRDLSKEKVLYAVGYAHLDTEWRWDYPTTINEYIWNTMADNFKLFEKYPGYVFNFSGANRYKMMKEYYPQEYERVRKMVAAGRWYPAGSSMEENDALATSHESILRQILLGTRYFRKDFGVSSAEYMLPDCFGFPASLPSLLAHCGLKGFSTQKLEWGSAVGIPFNVGRWVGPDGASVVAALNPGAYVTRVREDLSVNPDWVKRINEQGAKFGVYADYMYFGTGDIGGAPDDESVAWVEKSAASSKDVRVLSARSDQLFKDITPQQKAKLPSYKGEFLLTNHSAGSITSAAFMKRMNRKNELLAAKAEAASVIGDWLGGAPWNAAKMHEAWRLVLGAQFHDILPGTSIPRAYEFAWNDELLAANQFANMFADASGAVIRVLDTRSEGVPVVVFNPLSFEREDAVEANVAFEGGAPKAVRVFDGGGREVPSQVTGVDGNAMTIVFVGKVPSVGYAVFDARPAEAPCALATGLRATASSIENAAYRVKIDANGDVSSVFDKKAGRELLAAPARLEFHYERPQDWPAWNQDWEDREKPAVSYVDGPAAVRIVENGPARVALEVVREARHSRVIQVIRLAAGGGRVEFATHIGWATRESSLKAAFPLTVANPAATYSYGVGTVARGNNEPKKFEVPSHQWFDLTDRSGRYGVSVLDDCKYGSDKPADNVVRLTLLYTPGVRNAYREQAVQDFGEHDMLYALYGHRGGWAEGGTVREAWRVNQPLAAFTAPPHPGKLGKTFSFVSVGHPGVVMSALKKAEEGGETIVRFLETRGAAAKGVAVKFAAPVVGAREVNGVEDEVGRAEVRDGKLVFDLTPYRLRTFAVHLAGFEGAVEKPWAKTVELPYDTDVISRDEHKADGDFDGMGTTYPAEMLPDEIVSENIPFFFGPKADGASNAVSCRGQKIALPEGKFDRLYVLAASARSGGGRGRGRAGRDAFKVGETAPAFAVAPWSGFIGQWDRRLWAGDRPPVTDDELNAAEYAGLAPAYLRKDNVAFFTTHRHRRDGANEAYAYAYIYKYRIDLPEGAKNVTLPEDESIKVLAMTAARNENDAAAPAAALSDTLPRDAASFARYKACAKPVIAPAKAFIDYDRPLTIVMAARDPGAEIRYTLDGSAPTESSALYSGPITLDHTAVVKAAAFAKDKLPGAAAVAYFSRSIPAKSIRYIAGPAPRRGVPVDPRALIDIVRAPLDNYSAWQWFNGSDLDAVLDLGEVRTVTGVTLGCLVNNNSWIFAPESVEVLVSTDDKDYRPAVSETLGVPTEPQPSGVKDIRLDLRNVQARYIRVRAKNVGVLPKWHRSAGEKAWMALDEIIIN